MRDSEMEDLAVTKTSARVKRSPRNTIGSILAAAREQFGRNGLHGANIEDIASQSGRTRQLIYHYFRSKEHLYAEVLKSSGNEALDDTLFSFDYDALAPKEALAAFISHTYVLFLKVPEWRYLMLDENMHDYLHHDLAKSRAGAKPIVDTFFGIIERGVRDGVFRPGMDLQRLYALFYINVHGGTLIRDSVFSVVDVDIISDKGAEDWRRYLIAQFMTLVSLPDRSAEPEVERRTP